MSLQHLTPPYDKPEDFQHLYEEMHMSVFRYIYSLRSGPQQDREFLFGTPQTPTATLTMTPTGTTLAADEQTPSPTPQPEKQGHFLRPESAATMVGHW